jgi:hypothetical protein
MKYLVDTLKLNYANRFGPKLDTIGPVERIACLLVWLVLPLGTIILSAYLSFRILGQTR